jgi:hypothetical protein
MSDESVDQDGVCDIAGHQVPVTSNERFLAADERRWTSFVTNFGNWRLPPDLARTLGRDRAHLEWIHDTGELVLIAAVPHVGSVEAEVPTAEGVADEIGVLGGETTAVLPSSDPGTVRELFASEVVPAGTRLAILAQFEHGLQVHERLWGWHMHHRDDDGWAWLITKLFPAGSSS